MKSPYTGKDMILKKEKRAVPFRKESFEVVYQYYLCEESKEQFTTTELDELNMGQVWNQYRAAHNIPFPEEIRNIREKYELSASKMSEILGFGANSYRQYEAGEVPSIANARLIQTASNVTGFKQLVDLWNGDAATKEKVYKKITRAEIDKKEFRIEANLLSYFVGDLQPDIFTGFRKPSLERFGEMVAFFAERTQPFKTKMNKLLFYADFLLFKESGQSISGISYQAIQMGPVPMGFHSLFDYLERNNVITIKSVAINEDITGEQFLTHQYKVFNPALFTAKELDVLNRVAKRFAKSSTREIIDTSHLEYAWKENQASKDIISYEYAFDLMYV